MIECITKAEMEGEYLGDWTWVKGCWGRGRSWKNFGRGGQGRYGAGLPAGGIRASQGTFSSFYSSTYLIIVV